MDDLLTTADIAIFLGLNREYVMDYVSTNWKG